jgi:hypothetical protein
MSVNESKTLSKNGLKEQEILCLTIYLVGSLAFWFWPEGKRCLVSHKMRFFKKDLYQHRGLLPAYRRHNRA